MSDPIAAAEAAGKARDIANRFETAVFLSSHTASPRRTASTRPTRIGIPTARHSDTA